MFDLGIMECKFVFVVCGAKEHIDTLHFSLRRLKLFSAREILVVTDAARNEIPVSSDQVIDVKTPAHFDHHQASIYLKTSLYRILPVGPLYCYLDTDVIAVSNEVDDIFNHKTGVITFAPDHSRMHQFSPYAVNCGCLIQNRKAWSELTAMLNKYGQTPEIADKKLQQKQLQLKQRFELVKRRPLSLLYTAFSYAVPGNKMTFDNYAVYDKNERIWYDLEGNVILYDVPQHAIAQIEGNTRWRWSRLKRRWISPGGEDIHDLSCQHLREKIESKFEVVINDHHWQHWNGGVFLFDESSHVFMRLWHQRTMKIFKDPDWKTRDQGTLIATVWQLGLQKTPMLSKKFNFIADPSNPRLMLSDDAQYITDDAFETQHKPAFMHIFNQFGNANWWVWQWILEKTKL